MQSYERNPKMRKLCVMIQIGMKCVEKSKKKRQSKRLYNVTNGQIPMEMEKKDATKYANVK